MSLNEAQKITCRTYGGGDYAHVADMDEASAMSQADNGEFGDTLFVFLLRELSSKEDCEGLEEATRRVDRAIEELHTVRGKLEEAAA